MRKVRVVQQDHKVQQAVAQLVRKVPRDQQVLMVQQEVLVQLVQLVLRGPKEMRQQQ